MLQIFALNPENADAEVMWQFGPIVNAGWVERDSFGAGARRTQSILVATEGASDARILRLRSTFSGLISRISSALSMLMSAIISGARATS
jgi:hypothetical protein